MPSVARLARHRGGVCVRHLAHLYLTHRKVEECAPSSLYERRLPPRGASRALRERISTWVLARYRARASTPRIAPKVDRDARESPVLTLRLGRRGELADDEVALIVQHGAPDDIGSCLGVPNQPASTLYAEVTSGEGFARRSSTRHRVEPAACAINSSDAHDVLPKAREASRSGLRSSIERPDDKAFEVFVLDSPRAAISCVLANAEGTFLSAVDIGGARTRGKGDAEHRGAARHCASPRRSRRSSPIRLSTPAWACGGCSRKLEAADDLRPTLAAEMPWLREEAGRSSSPSRARGVSLVTQRRARGGAF